MKLHFKNILMLITLLFGSFSAQSSEEVGSVEDSILRGLRGALKAVELPLSVAKERAEDLYVYNGGTDLDLAAPLDLVASNEYIDVLEICDNYWIKLDFHDVAEDLRFDSDELSGTTEIPLPKNLLGKRVYLIPVYDSGDYLITTWECVTNFTLDNAVFKGDSGVGVQMEESTTIATRSVLAKYTDDPILEKCVYAESTQWNNVETAYGTCTGVPT